MYIKRLMIEYGVDWELQLMIFGVFTILLVIAISKIASKVDYDG